MGIFSSISDAVGFNPISAITNHFVGRRDRDHEEHRQDRIHARSRADFLSDRDNQREHDAKFLTRLVDGARDAGLHPLAAIGQNISGGPSTVFHDSSSSSTQTRPSLPHSSRDRSAEAVNIAQADKLRAETDFIQEQAAASRLARATQSITPQEQVTINPEHAELQQKGGERTMFIDTPFGRLLTSPNSNASDMEDRFGELGGSALGLMNIPADLIHTAKHHLSRKVGKMRDFIFNNLFGDK